MQTLPAVPVQLAGVELRGKRCGVRVSIRLSAMPARAFAPQVLQASRTLRAEGERRRSWKGDSHTASRRQTKQRSGRWSSGMRPRSTLATGRCSGHALQRTWSPNSRGLAHGARGTPLPSTWRKGHWRYGRTLHRISNIVIEGGSADSIAVRSYVDAILMPAANTDTIRFACGVYRDIFAQPADAWLIRRRRFEPVLIEDRPR